MESSKTIEITVISAENLLLNRNQPVKKDAFAVLKTDPYNSQSTGINKKCGNHPIWNQKMILNLPINASYINVEVHSGSRIIGYANIPVSDFSGGFLPENYLSFLSYRLRDANGEKNGIVNLSVIVQGNRGIDAGCAVSCLRPWMGVPVDNKVAGGIVMGIPVRY